MDRDVNEEIAQYLREVSRNLSHLPEPQRAETLRDIESHIHDALRVRTEGRELTSEDVRALLAEMDPPESYAQTGQYTAIGTPREVLVLGRSIPRVLAFGLAVLGVMIVVQLIIGITTAQIGLFISVVLSGLLLYGLYFGSKVAYVVTIFFILLGSVFSGIQNGPAVGLLTLLLNCLVLIPVLLCTSYFFPRRSAARSEAEST